MAIALRYEKASRSRSLVPFVFGFSFGLVVLIMIVKTPVDAYRESKQAKWPSVVASIKQSTVRKSYHKGYEWHIEAEARYSIDGEVLTSSVHSRVGSSREARDMYGWASQHPPGTSLPIRYDPQHHNTIVLDGSDMPETGSQVPIDIQLLLVFSVLSIILISIGGVLRRRGERGTLNRDNANE